MDVNGTRSHLILEEADWDRCLLKELEISQDGEIDSVALSQVPSPHSQRNVSLEPSARRGAGRDRFGNWYWIGKDEQRIFWLPCQARHPRVYWDQATAPRQATPGEFRPASSGEPVIAELAGLAVTEHHYLVVGNRKQSGLLIFDLHAGGTPVQLLFPADVPFQPFDMVPAPDGGVWVLDRKNHVYWGLDRSFRVVSEPDQMQTVEPKKEALSFHPVGSDQMVRPGRRFPVGFPLDEANESPVSIEAWPGGRVLILDSPESTADPSTLFRYHLAELQEKLVLPDLPSSTQDDTMRPLVGHDMAYTPEDKRLYIVERDSRQAVAFDWRDLVAPSAPEEAKPDYLAMHFLGSRALVAQNGQVFYDVTGSDGTDTDDVTRWVQLHANPEPHYEHRGTLHTYRFDGRERGCVWHRLFLDASIPEETTIKVWTRAHDDEQLLESVPFSPEPDLYLRAAGAEEPHYEPFGELDHLPENTGTWELLIQRARGRHAQVMLELTGNGRTTPRIRGLRVYYPRFSYPRNYLPSVYLDDEGSASFLERLLANMEGFYAEIEGRMRDAYSLFDARSAPPEALDWLAGWVGLAMDPLWAGIQKQRSGETGARLGRSPDRRRLFIRYARKLYERRGTPDGIRFSLLLLLDPYLEQTLRRLKDAAVDPGHTMHAELARFGLVSPTATTSEEKLEDLLYELILLRPSRIRVVERYLTRGGRELVEGDRASSQAGAQDPIVANAHRLSVLVPEGLTSEEDAMARRIVELEKPAHVQFEMRRYWYGFRVGEARLGIDTTLDQQNRFVALVLGQHYLSDGYLYPSHPWGVKERMVSDRDTLGGTSPL